MEPRSEPESSNDGYRALHSAARFGETEEVRKCLEGGTNPNAEDDNGRTALHYVSTTEAARVLLAGGANIEASDKQGWTPLCNATYFERDVVVEFLLAAGASATTGTSNGRTGLHLAHSADVARALIRAGAQIDASDKRGIVPLHVAIDRGREGVVEALISAGAKLDASTSDGSTPLHLVRGDSDAKLLVEAGAPVNRADLKGQTPLHVAVVKGKSWVSEVLLAAGASLEVKDKRGWTPMAYALFEEDEMNKVGLSSSRMCFMFEREVSLIACGRYTPRPGGCAPSTVL
jgi:ankyrin repeat protein